MDKTKSPGISIESIHLIDCHVSDIDNNAGLHHSLGITKLIRSTTEDGLKLSVSVAFDLMHGIKGPPCAFQCTFLAIYSREQDSNMAWNEFTDVMTVMHMIPYVREFVSSVSLRLPIKELILPPTNVNTLVREYQNTRATVLARKQAKKKTQGKGTVKKTASKPRKMKKSM